MTIDTSLKDDAYALYAEFGPGLKTPRWDRLRAKYSGLSEAQLDALILDMEKVSATVWELAKGGGDKLLGEGQVEAQLRAAHPFLMSVGLSRAKFLVNYYAWHEGWAK
jgi:hypothetical protein